MDNVNNIQCEQLEFIDRINDMLGVTLDENTEVIQPKKTKSNKKANKEETYKGMKASNEVKVLRIPVDKSFLEGQLCEIPFISYYKTKKPITTVEYVWVDSKGTERSVEVRGSKWGIPDEYCFDVLIALFKIYIKQNQSIEFNCETNKWDMPKKINFSFKELATTMGYKTTSSDIYNKLDKSLEVLNDTVIYNKTNGLLDIGQNTYVGLEQKESVKIIHSYKSYKYAKLSEGEKRIDYKKIKDNTSVVIDDFFYDNLRNSYFKIFNYEQYSLLKMGIAKKIFILLNKWRAERNKVFLKWETLYQRIPLDNSKTEKYRKKRIRDACKQLIDNGFIVDVNDNEYGVEFIFVKDNDQIQESVHEPTIGDNEKVEIIEDKDTDKLSKTSKYNTISNILACLYSLNLDAKNIQYLLGNLSIDNIKTTLDYIENMSDEDKKKYLETLLSVHDI